MGAIWWNKFNRYASLMPASMRSTNESHTWHLEDCHLGQISMKKSMAWKDHCQSHKCQLWIITSYLTMLHTVNKKSFIIVITIANTIGPRRAVGLLCMYVSVCASVCVQAITFQQNDLRLNKKSSAIAKRPCNTLLSRNLATTKHHIWKRLQSTNDLEINTPKVIEIAAFR